jgi:hypothetical protein
LTEIVCDYVYLLSGERERRPSSGQFAPGEFTKLFEEVFNTVDLIFRNGIDWQALSAAMQDIRAQPVYADAGIRIQSIEDKGEGVFVVRVHTPSEVNKERLHAELTTSYQNQLALIEARYQALLAGKDELIVEFQRQSADMKEIVTLLASRPLVMQTGEGATVSYVDSHRTIHIGRDNTGQINLGDCSSQVSHAIQQIPSVMPQSEELRQHLEALRQLIEGEPALREVDKADAFRQVETLAQSASLPLDPSAQAKAKNAKNWFTNVLPTLTNGTHFLTEVWKLIDAVMKWLPFSKIS